MARCGFGSKVTLHAEPTRAEYCSGRFWPTATGASVWGPKPGRALAKSGWRLNVGPEPAGYRKGIALANLADYAHVPILRAMALWQVAATGAIPGVDAAQHDPRSYRAHTARAHPCSRAAVTLAAELYGVTEADVLGLEAAILAAPLRPCLWASPLLDRVLDADVGLPRYIHAQRVDVLYDGCGSDTRAIHEIMRC